MEMVCSLCSNRIYSEELSQNRCVDFIDIINSLLQTLQTIQIHIHFIGDISNSSQHITINTLSNKIGK